MTITANNFYEHYPLIKFSLYTHLQTITLIELGVSIKEKFDKIICGKNIVDMSSGDPSGNIWLWVIGVYEVTRTMADRKWKGSWRESKYSEIFEFKKRIANLRVPFAKQEYRGNEKAINSENGFFDIDFESKSYLYEVKGYVFNIRNEIDRFETLVKSISHEDILRDLRDNNE